MRKAVFFDRDGTINYRIVGDYVKKPKEFHFIPDFFDFFRKVKESGFLAIVISNQQGIGKGEMSIKDIDDIHNYMQAVIENKTGFRFDDIYYCPDLKDSGSTRRKPEPGMLLEAKMKWNIDMSSSWMIGDSQIDAEAGKNAGTQTALIGDYTKDKVPEAELIVRDLDKLWEMINMQEDQ